MLCVLHMQIKHISCVYIDFGHIIVHCLFNSNITIDSIGNQDI